MIVKRRKINRKEEKMEEKKIFIFILYGVIYFNDFEVINNLIRRISIWNISN